MTQKTFTRKIECVEMIDQLLGALVSVSLNGYTNNVETGKAFALDDAKNALHYDDVEILVVVK